MNPIYVHSTLARAMRINGGYGIEGRDWVEVAPMPFNTDETVFLTITTPPSHAMESWLPGTWFNWTPAKREPTEDEKKVHRAINAGNGDPKRFGHGQFIGDDE
jgi:hypothetical protein